MLPNVAVYDFAHCHNTCMTVGIPNPWRLPSHFSFTFYSMLRTLFYFHSLIVRLFCPRLLPLWLPPLPPSWRPRWRVSTAASVIARYCYGRRQAIYGQSVWRGIQYLMSEKKKKKNNYFLITWCYRTPFFYNKLKIKFEIIS